MMVRVRFVPQKTEAQVWHSIKEGLGFVFHHTRFVFVDDPVAGYRVFGYPGC